MIFYLDYPDWDLVLEYFAKLQKVSLYEILLGQKAFQFNKIKLTSWASAQYEIVPSDSLFGDLDEEVLLVDIENLTFNKDDQKFLEHLDKSRNIYFFRGAGVGLSAEEKKIFKNLGWEYLLLKEFASSTKQSILDEYLANHQLQLLQTQKTQLIKNTNNYTELVNLLEICFLSGDPELVLTNYFDEQKLPIFMLPFNAKTTQAWFERISEDDIQLAFSLIFGKLDKQDYKLSNQLKQKLILTDKQIKTNSKISPNVWWKLFLWQSKQQLS